MTIPFGLPPDEFARPTGFELGQSFGRALIPVADVCRDIAVQLGLRPYEVHIVRTKWTVDTRGAGSEIVIADIPLLPVPKVTSLDGLAEIVNPIGVDELGSVRVSEISGRYSEQFLRGLDAQGNSPARDEQFYWEILFPQLGRVDDYGYRRRFTMAAAPNYEPDNVQWTVVLQRARGDRNPDGSPSNG